MVARSIFVPNDCQPVAMILNPIEAKPVPRSRGQKRKYFHHIVRTRTQSDYSCNQQVGEGRVVIITTAATFAVNPLSSRFIKIFADVGLAFSVLAVDIGQKG